jgi:hypothetical protein
MKFNPSIEYTKESRIREQQKNKKKNYNKESRMRDPSLYKSDTKHRNQIYKYLSDE